MSGIFVESVGFEFEVSTIHPFKLVGDKMSTLDETDYFVKENKDYKMVFAKDMSSIFRKVFPMENKGNMPVTKFLPFKKDDSPLECKFSGKNPDIDYISPDTRTVKHYDGDKLSIEQIEQFKKENPHISLYFIKNECNNFELEFLVTKNISNTDLNNVIIEQFSNIYKILISEISFSGIYRYRTNAWGNLVELCPPLVEYSLMKSGICFLTELPLIEDISDQYEDYLRLGFMIKNKVAPQMTIGIKIFNIEQTFLKFEHLFNNRNIPIINLKSISLLLDSLEENSDEDLGGKTMMEIILRNICFYIIYFYQQIKTKFSDITFDDEYEFNTLYFKNKFNFLPRNSIIEMIEYITITYKVSFTEMVVDMIGRCKIYDLNIFLKMVLENKLKTVDEKSSISKNAKSPVHCERLSDNFIIVDDVVFFEIRTFGKLLGYTGDDLRRNSFMSILNRNDILLPIKASKDILKKRKRKTKKIKTKKKKHKKKHNKKKHKKKHTKKKRKLSSRAPKSTRTPSRVR